MDELTARLTKQLEVEEGVKLKPYADTKGILTIGVGRNLVGVGIYPDEAMLMLANDIRDHIKFMSEYAWYTAQSDVRRAALIDLSFMGPGRLLHFVNMIHFLTIGEFDKAASEIDNSQWAKDVGLGRTKRVSDMIRRGDWPTDTGYIAT